MIISRGEYVYTMDGPDREDCKYIYLGAYTEKGARRYNKSYFQWGEKEGVQVTPKNWRSFDLLEATDKERHLMACWLVNHRRSRDYYNGPEYAKIQARREAERKRDYERFRSSD